MQSHIPRNIAFVLGLLALTASMAYARHALDGPDGPLADFSWEALANPTERAVDSDDVSAGRINIATATTPGSAEVPFQDAQTDALEVSEGMEGRHEEGFVAESREVRRRTRLARERHLQRLATDDPDGVVRSAAVDALLELGAVNGLVDVVAQTSAPADVRREAIEAIEDLEPLEPDEVDEFEAMTTPALLQAVGDPDPDMYEPALYILEESTDPAVPAALWGMFEGDLTSNYDRAEAILGVLDFLGEEVDEAWEALDYFDPTDWAAVARQRVANGWTQLDCQSTVIACAGE